MLELRLQLMRNLGRIDKKSNLEVKKSIVETPAKTTKHGDNVKSESAEKPPTKDSQLPAAEMARASDKKRIFEEPG